MSATETAMSALERQMSWGATIGFLLGVLVWDNCVHGGQIAYLRGYYKGMSWFV